MSDKIVEILGGTPGIRSKYMSSVYDRASSKYLGVAYSKKDIKLFNEVKRLRELAKSEVKEQDTVKIAVIDTGVLHRHPMIEPILVGSVDFTGEGLEDLNGHGTIVALLATQTTTPINLLSAKALDAEGRGKPQDIVKAIDWSVENGAKVINIFFLTSSD